VGMVILTRDMKASAREELARRLGLPGVWREWVEEGARLFQETLPRLVTSHLREEARARVFDLLRPYRHLEPLIAGAAASKGVKRKNLLRYLTRWRYVRPLLTGDDLKELGLRPGPVYQKVLDGLLRARLEGKVKTRRDETKWVKYIYKSLSPGSFNSPEGRVRGIDALGVF